MMGKALIAIVAALMNAAAAQAMETKSLDGLCEFRFECDRMVEDVELPRFKADDRMVVCDPRGKAQMTEDHQAEYTKLMQEELFAIPEIAGVAIWQMTDAKTYTRRTRGFYTRSYGVNTGGIFDLYRRPKMAVEAVREVFSAKSERD